MSQTAQDHSQVVGHRSELKRTLKFFSSFAVAFSFISITTGIFSSYGLVLTTSGPAGIWTWPLVAVGHLIVAVIFGELAGKVPVSGYSYQWVSRLVNRGFGWFSGWVGFCYLVLVVPAVDFGLAPIILQLIGVDASKAAISWMVVGILVLQALINAFGARLATRINNIAVYTEVIGIVGIIIFLGVVVLLSGRANWGMLVNTGNTMAAGNTPYIGSFVMSMVMGAFTLVGFEAAANLSEETINARSNVPKAMIFSVALSSIIGMLFLIVLSISIKSLPAATASASPILLILRNNFGNAIASLFLVLCVVSIFACGLIIMASASRLIYAMSRDNVFFFSKQFKKISKKSAVPTNAIFLVLGLGIVAVIFSDSLTLLLGASAVLPSILYLITVLCYAFKHKSLPAVAGSFNLGKWRTLLLAVASLWLVFEIGILTIPTSYHQVALVVIGLLALGTVLYWAVFRRGIADGRIGMAIDQSSVDYNDADHVTEKI